MHNAPPLQFLHPYHALLKWRRFTAYRQQQQQSSGEIFFRASWKVWNASPLLENGPNLNSRLFEWRLARGASDAFLFIAQSRRRVLVSPTLQSGGGGLRPHGVQLSYAKAGNIDTGAEESEKQHKVLSFRWKICVPTFQTDTPRGFSSEREREKGRN